jgi:beta-mannosidase
MRYLALILLFFPQFAFSADTLHLKQWRLKPSPNTPEIPFQEAVNLNDLLRLQASINQPQLRLRFAPESIAFRDSVASLPLEIVCDFDVPAQRRNLDIQFNYLQTFTRIYLNDQILGETNNAFRLWSFPVPKRLLKKHNVLRIQFRPQREEVEELTRRNFPMPAGNQVDSIKTAPYIRQPQQEFGWDFCYPEIYTGFRVLPQLIMHAPQEVQSLRVVTRSIAYGDAQLDIHLKGIVSKKKQVLHLQIDTLTEHIQLKPGAFDTLIHVQIPKAKLWWPIAMHEGPQLYTADCWFDKNVTEKQSFRFGVRMMDLEQQPDSAGISFLFKVNYKPVFANGANVVMPNEAFEGDRIAGLSTKELQYVQSAGFNMLRIWGGGTYLPEAFFNWADEHGVMIWQDAMFACSYYPADDAFLDNVKQEIVYQSERLAKHPSMALWCGNNEINVGRMNWGWETTYQYRVPQKSMLDHDYVFFFESFLPEILRQTSLEIPYLPSTPVSNWGKTSELKTGDNHDWSVWHGEYPVDSVLTRIPRFMSEYGFPSFPSIEVLEKAYGKRVNEIDLRDLVKSYKGIGLLLRYLDENGLPHASNVEIITSSQYLQKQVYAAASKAHQKAAPYCMGTLFWQLNEVAPVMSWSVLNWDGSPKQSAGFFEP